MRGRFARFKEETWALPDCGRRVMRNSTFLNLATWTQGGVGASEKQKESGTVEQRTVNVGTRAELGNTEETSLLSCDFIQVPSPLCFQMWPSAT